MVKIRVFYDDDREITETIKLLSPRLTYCKTYPEDTPKRAYCSIETSDLLVADDSGEEAPERGEEDV